MYYLADPQVDQPHLANDGFNDLVILTAPCVQMIQSKQAFVGTYCPIKKKF